MGQRTDVVEAQEVELLTLFSIRKVALTALVVPCLLGGAVLPAYADVPVTQVTQDPLATIAPITPTTPTTPTALITSTIVAPPLIAAPAVVTVAAAVPQTTHLQRQLAKVVRVAKKYAGARYIRGGSTPAGFDCSGFTSYVYARVGIKLPHSAFKQGHMGKRIPRSKARPGDLVVFANGSHVGIYLKPGYYIDAPRPGKKVGVHKIWTNAYYIVRVGH
jgi:cell wall-associated NlpC family hydrolase